MSENDIHKCLLSYGIYPMTLILKELEGENRFEECNIILKAVLSYRAKYPIGQRSLRKNIIPILKLFPPRVTY